jgi:hypothetical protein
VEQRARAAAATTSCLHFCACEGVDENSWRSRQRHTLASSALQAAGRDRVCCVLATPVLRVEKKRILNSEKEKGKSHHIRKSAVFHKAVCLVYDLIPQDSGKRVSKYTRGLCAVFVSTVFPFKTPHNP